MPRLLSGLCIGILLTNPMIGQQQAHPSKPRPAAASKAADANVPSEETINAFLRQMFGYDSTLSWKVQSIRPAQASGITEVDVVISNAQGQQSNTFYVTSDGKHAITGEIIPFGSQPFAADRAKLEKGVDGPTRGPATASVTLVEFSDLQCPHCKAAQPTIDKLLSEEANARLVFQSFPLPNHDWAEKAAAYGDCIARGSNDAFWKFMQGAYDAQAEITAANADEKLKAIADAAGAKSAEVAACAAQPETESRVERSVALGKSLEVTSTPTLFINGRRINVGGIPYEVLKNLVDFAAKEGESSQAQAK
jgi:protein-disulfide isomerase